MTEHRRASNAEGFAPLPLLPRMIPATPIRPTQANIPDSKEERGAILKTVRDYLERTPELVPPVPLDELRRRTEDLLAGVAIDARFRDFTAVLMNNELWRERLATVPYHRRLLLLPKCLRVESHCPAPFDELGLLCKKCGMCSIQDLQEEAERLGYAVLVAEGSPIVMAIIETGKIEAIVGVSCLSVLERAFPYMEASAIPGMAIPLLQDDCKDTAVDTDWIWDVIHLTSEDKTRRLDLVGLREEVDSWFTPSALSELFGAPSGLTEEIAHSYLALAGKRWRPFLTVAMRQALKKDPGEPLPSDLQMAAVAVECFHKASLIHDDIEDGDSLRYGEETLHERYGIPMALNVGDLLIGEGYRLLASCECPPGTRARLLRIAAEGHRTLCLGQGSELSWSRAPLPLSSLQVLEIFRKKTAPAFEVALRIGAALAGEEAALTEVIERFSASLGIAYQIRDDLDDLAEGNASQDLLAQRPTLPLAVAHERAKGREKALMNGVWTKDPREPLEPAQLQALFSSLGVEARTRELLEAYKDDAIRSLWKLDNPNVKGLLRRVVGKIFNETEIKGWCNEFEARDAPGRPAGVQSA